MIKRIALHAYPPCGAITAACCCSMRNPKTNTCHKNTHAALAGFEPANV